MDGRINERQRRPKGQLSDQKTEPKPRDARFRAYRRSHSVHQPLLCHEAQGNPNSPPCEMTRSASEYRGHPTHLPVGGR